MDRRQGRLTDPVAGLSRRLLAWYRRSRRDLPWRRTSDPYAIWISEVMLQQTTVATAIPRWGRFLARFPGVAALAAAEERDVLAEWSGLGYYARARNLHRAARALARDGAFPRTAEALAALPGIGPYTAAAIASIAFGEPAAVVDGNVIRVLFRLHGLRLDPKAPASRRRAQEIADALLPARHPGDHNQALMELGATVCTPRAPRCPECPLRTACRAHDSGEPEAFPGTPARGPITRITLAAGIAFREGRLVLLPDTHLVTGHLTLPLAADADALAKTWRARTGGTVASALKVGSVRHAVLDRRYLVDVYRVVEGPRPRERKDVSLILPDALSSIPHGGLLRKIVSLASVRPGSREAWPGARARG